MPALDSLDDRDYMIYAAMKRGKKWQMEQNHRNTDAQCLFSHRTDGGTS
jgi:hypothetical protein